MAEVKHDTKRSDTQLIGEVRIAYPFHHVKRTKSAGGALMDTPRHDAAILYPKLGPAETCPNYKRLSDMCMEAATRAWAKWPEGGKWPIMDGDVPFPHKPKPGETALTAEQLTTRNAWRAGSWHIEATNYLSGPKVSVLQNGALVDIDFNMFASAEALGQPPYKSGDFGYASVCAYTFQNKTWGVNFGYEGVAYTRQGELIGGGPKSSAQMFAGIPLGAPGPAAPAAPQAPGAPPLPPTSLPSPPLAPAAPSTPPLPVFPR